MKQQTILWMALLLTACHSKKDKDLMLEGKVEREQLSVVSKLPGKIAEVRVAEGDEIKAGDTLVVLDLPEVDARKTQARGAYTSAQAQYDMARKGATANQLVQLKAKVAGLKEQLDFAEKSSGRLKRLLADSLVSQQKYDEVYAKYQGARNQYVAAVAELDDASNGARAEQQQMALGQQERALGAIDEVNVAEQEKYIRAPQDMSVETITLKQGELALAGYTLVSGFLKQTTYFRFTIPEARLSAVEKGKAVKIYIPYQKKSIEGKIVWVKPLSTYANITSAYPDYEQGQTLYEIKVAPLQAADADGLIIKSAVQLDLATK